MASLSVFFLTCVALLVSGMFSRAIFDSLLDQYAVAFAFAGAASLLFFCVIFSRFCPDELAGTLNFRSARRLFINSALLGIAVNGLMLGMLVVFGARFTGGSATGFFSLAVTFFWAAVIEEIMYRGLLIPLAMRFMPAWSAVLLVSLLFAAAHSDRPTLGIFSTFIWGLSFAQILLLYRSLWASVGLHFGSNLAGGVWSGIMSARPGPLHLKLGGMDETVASFICAALLCLGLFGVSLYRAVTSQQETS